MQNAYSLFTILEVLNLLSFFLYSFILIFVVTYHDQHACLVQDILNFEEFREHLTSEEQKELLKYLAPLDTDKFPDKLISLSCMFIHTMNSNEHRDFFLFVNNCETMDKLHLKRNKKDVMYFENCLSQRNST